MARHLARIHGTEEDKVSEESFEKYSEERGGSHLQLLLLLKSKSCHSQTIYPHNFFQVNCPFYFKIGACRHADRCSRIHHRPAFSQTILIKHVYRHPVREAELKAAREGRNVNPTDVDEEEAREGFLVFFE